jgi:hypothetical protein
VNEAGKTTENNKACKHKFKDEDLTISILFFLLLVQKKEAKKSTAESKE